MFFSFFVSVFCIAVFVAAGTAVVVAAAANGGRPGGCG